MKTMGQVQLHGAPLIRGKAAHFTDHVPNKLAVFGQTLWRRKKRDSCQTCYTSSEVESLPTPYRGNEYGNTANFT
ncbi:hypothetical protein EYF80_011865 [Liparis tanakae]|uniref:Uncharacterized protein n=1 Tax=Liparis tanakae TaxID=230148 RepID=A0A4Z2IL67_9TELE|nr:hypothetical protein EYF80_011865 [Liparis tanakae]